MDTSREKAAGPESRGSIRLRYSRQFQSGGHAHTVDAESLLPVGASREMRDQVVHELEASVEQLARKIVQQSGRPAEATRPQAQAPGRAVQAPATPARAQSEPEATAVPKSTTSPAPPATRVPVSESMPATPSARGEGTTISLPQFLTAINKYLKISPIEAMELLNVATLDGLNYRDAYRQLQEITAKKDAERSNLPSRSAQQKPIVEAPRSTNKGTSPTPMSIPPGRGNPPAPTSRPPTNQATDMASSTRTQGQAALQSMPHPAQQAAPVTRPVPEADEHETVQRQKPEPGVDFAGSPKAPIPIQIGTVRDLSPRSYKFEEEEDEEYELPGDNAGDHSSGRLKLEELKEIRGSTAASAGRLKVLDNVIGEQISGDQLQKIIQAAWNITTTKKLKTDQIEALITWAKEDFFETEVEEVLAWLADEEA